MNMKNQSRSRLRATRGDIATVATVAWNRARFRRLKLSERVWIGDYIKSAAGGYEPWDGPGGFSASSFAKPVYRLRKAAVPRSN
jgi:hypothetical protein